MYAGFSAFCAHRLVPVANFGGPGVVCGGTRVVAPVGYSSWLAQVQLRGLRSG